jgi:shikimate dehydrogenase
MRALGIEGLSVTMPHKTAVARAVDDLSPVARRLHAVNCVRRRGDDLVGENTDGEGFLRALREDADFDPANRRCLVLGAGGAARAVVVALADAGAAEVAVAGRRPEPVAAAAALAGPAGRVAAVEEADGADLIVNATPVGMAGGSDGGDGMPLDPGRLGGGQIVCDLIYHPLWTRLLEVAQSRGALTVNGVGMLVHQAGLAFRLWTGFEAPLGEMREAALGQLLRTGTEQVRSGRSDGENRR